MDAQGSAPVARFIPVPKLYHDMGLRYRYKYLFLYVAFFCTYLGLTFHRIDSTWAHETKLVYDTALDRIGGIPAAKNTWCDQDTRMTEGNTNASCWWDYYDMENLDDMTFFLTNRLSAMGPQIRLICPECIMAIAVSSENILGLSLDKFACSDFTSHRGSDEYRHRDCDKVDAEWAAYPVSYSPPCCQNRTLVEASVLLKAWAHWQDVDAFFAQLAGSEVEALLSDGVVQSSSQARAQSCSFDREVASLNVDLDFLFYCYLVDKLGDAGNFMQVIVSRQDRFMGMNLDAELRSHGWNTKWVKPTVRLWSLRVDTLELQYLLTGLWVGVVLVIASQGVLALCVGFRTWRWQVHQHTHWRRAVAFAPPLVSPFFVEILRIYMTTPLWTMIITMTEMIMLLGFVVQLDVLDSARVIVRIITKASKGVLTFTVILVPLWFIMGLLYCQLFGIHRYNGLAQALHDLFSVFVIGKEVDHEDFIYGPTSYWLMYYISSVMLVLTLSQVFITILIDAYSESRKEEARLLQVWRIPQGYAHVGEPFTWKEYCIDLLCDTFCTYSPKYRCWSRALMYGFELAMSRQRNEGASQVMYTEADVRVALAEVGLSPFTMDRFIEHWACVMDDGATAHSSTTKSKGMSYERSSPAKLDDLLVDDPSAELVQLRASTFALATEVGCMIPYRDLEVLGAPALHRLNSTLSKLSPCVPSGLAEELVELRTSAYSLAKQQGRDISYPELQQMSKASLEAVLQGLQAGQPQKQEQTQL